MIHSSAMEQEIGEIKHIVKEIKNLQSLINEQEIRLNNKLQEPRKFKERAGRLFSHPEKEAEKILAPMEKSAKTLKIVKRSL